MSESWGGGAWTAGWCWLLSPTARKMVWLVHPERNDSSNSSGLTLKMAIRKRVEQEVRFMVFQITSLKRQEGTVLWVFKQALLPNCCSPSGETL